MHAGFVRPSRSSCTRLDLPKALYQGEKIPSRYSFSPYLEIPRSPSHVDPLPLFYSNDCETRSKAPCTPSQSHIQTPACIVCMYTYRPGSAKLKLRRSDYQRLHHFTTSCYIFYAGDYCADCAFCDITQNFFCNSNHISLY